MVVSLLRPHVRGPVLAGLLASVCTLWAAPAAATELEDFQTARNAYDSHNFARAVTLFEEMVGGREPAITSAVLVQESRKYLAASYVLVGNETSAEQQFEWLLRDNPSYPFNPSLFPRPVVDIFERVRDRLAHERNQAAEQRRQAEAQRVRERRAAQRELIAMAAEQEVVIRHDPALAWAPFGVGQFQNGNESLGTTFLVLETATLAAAIVSFAVWTPFLIQYDASRGYAPVAPPDEGLLVGLQVANWVSSGAFTALALIGVIEAVVNFVPSHTVRRHRRIPRRVLDRLDLAVGPTSIGLRLRF
jgi:hypothetical protein